MRPSTDLSLYTYAPNNVGFTHTMPERFTYFSGSKAGARTTFGFSCEEISALINKEIEEFVKQYAEARHPTIRQYLDSLGQLRLTVQQQATNLKNGRSYATDYDAAQAVVASGHIPIMLAAALPAVQYERSARSVSAYDVGFYFGQVPAAREQCREYLVKQDIMKAITAFRENANSQRYTNAKDESLYFFNSLINMLDEKIIKPNQKSMPTDCEQFDLFDTFRQKIHKHLCEMPNKPAYGEFFAAMAKVLKSCEGATTYEAQQALSNNVYALCINFIKQHTGIDPEQESKELTVEQDDNLQAVLPLVAYLNSEQNPFARNGVFGKMVSSSFHTEALAAYKSHESRERPLTHHYMVADAFEYKAQTRQHPSFDEDQMEKLLYGAEDAVENKGVVGGFFAGLGQTMRGMLTDGSANASQNSDSSRRRRLLALPTPQQYLMLEGPKGPSANEAPQKRP